MTAIASLAMVNLDCDDPPALAQFYHDVLGWEITHSQDEYAMLSNGATAIGFGQVAGYEPPRWPDPSSPSATTSTSTSMIWTRPPRDAWNLALPRRNFSRAATAGGS